MLTSLTGDDYLSTIQTDELYKFIARYKFVIAYENSACDDYITEKLWRPLMLGVVPIYFGAPNIQVKKALLLIFKNIQIKIFMYLSEMVTK